MTQPKLWGCTDIAAGMPREHAVSGRVSLPQPGMLPNPRPRWFSSEPNGRSLSPVDFTAFPRTKTREKRHNGLNSAR